MLNQYQKCTLATLGKPKSTIQELDVSNLKETITEKHKKRVISALEGEFYVFPESKSLYRVESIKDGAVSDVYNVNLNSTSSCSCYDYLFNCSGKGIFCKHIWRTKFLIELGCLPDDSEYPYNWFIDELNQDIKWIESRVESGRGGDYISEISDIHSDVRKQKNLGINYKIYFNRRLNVLMEVRADSI